MNDIKKEWPLIVFTTCAPICTGALAIAAALSLTHAYPESETLPLHAVNFMVWAVLLLSLLCSTLHLGHPLRALRAVTRLGNSNVSNEVFAGALFAGFGAILFLDSQWLSTSDEIMAALLVLLIALALLFVFFQCCAYRIRTVGTWNALSFSIEPALIALQGGICLEGILVLPYLSEALWVGTTLCVMQLLLAMASVCMVFAQGRSVENAQSARPINRQGQHLWAMLNGARVILVILGAFLWCLGLLFSSTLFWLMIVGCIMTLAGIVFGRVSFYAFYVNVGIVRL